MSQGPDLAAVKQRQQQTWASGDYHAVAAKIVLVAEQLVDAADLRAGWRVLDVAAGSGNATIAAARHGCDDLAALAAEFDRLGGDGPVAIPSTYLEAIAIAR